MTDPVNHPAHYTANPSGIECIDIAEVLGFNVGNLVKYVWRLGLKGDSREQLQKALWYANRAIVYLKNVAHGAPRVMMPAESFYLRCEQVCAAYPGSVLAEVLTALTAEPPSIMWQDVERARVVIVKALEAPPEGLDHPANKLAREAIIDERKKARASVNATNILGALALEVERVTNVVLPAYVELGAPGMAAAVDMRRALRSAEQATVDGDVEAMMKAWLELREFHT